MFRREQGLVAPHQLQRRGAAEHLGHDLGPAGADLAREQGQGLRIELEAEGAGPAVRGPGGGQPVVEIQLPRPHPLGEGQGEQGREGQPGGLADAAHDLAAQGVVAAHDHQRPGRPDVVGDGVDPGPGVGDSGRAADHQLREAERGHPALAGDARPGLGPRLWIAVGQDDEPARPAPQLSSQGVGRHDIDTGKPRVRLHGDHQGALGGDRPQHLLGIGGRLVGLGGAHGLGAGQGLQEAEQAARQQVTGFLGLGLAMALGAFLQLGGEAAALGELVLEQPLGGSMRPLLALQPGQGVLGRAAFPLQLGAGAA